MEQVHRDLMRCYVRRGSRAAALRQFESCVRVLRAELDVGRTFTCEERRKFLHEDITCTEPEYETRWIHDRYADGGACAAGIGKLTIIDNDVIDRYFRARDFNRFRECSSWLTSIRARILA